MKTESVTYKAYQRLGNLGIRARMLLCAAFPMIVVVVIAVLGLKGLADVVTGSEELYVLAQEALDFQKQKSVSTGTPDPSKVGDSLSPSIKKRALAIKDKLWTRIDEIRVRNNRTRVLVIVGVPVVVILTMCIFYLLSGTVQRPFLKAESVIAMAKQGDSTGRLEILSKNEVGRFARALNDMLESVRSQTAQVLEGVRVLTEASSEISATGAQLARSTSKASSAIAEASVTVEQVLQSARLTGEKAKSVAENASKSVEIAISGKQATEDTVDRMNMIKDQIESTRDTVVKLSEHSQAIEEIIGTVQDLADQSNLLAVNASIEAARAGDYGRGFAVVAQEIKSLSDQSREATNQVRIIIDDTQKWISAAVMTTETGGRAVEGGVKQSKVAGQAIRALSESVEASSQEASVIDIQTEQQVTGVHQVSEAITNIEEAMKHNLDAASQLESASGKLNELQASLQDMVRRHWV